MVALSVPDAILTIAPPTSSSIEAIGSALLVIVFRRIGAGSAGRSMTAGTNIGGVSCFTWLRICRRQVNNCPGDNPCRRATALTDNSPLWLSATMRFFSSSLQSRRRPVPVKTSNRCNGTSSLVPCVNPVIVICRSLVWPQHQQSRADPEGGIRTSLTINYGTHGFESRLKDVKTRREKYKRESTDLEEIPLYFQIWSPSSSQYAIIAFQSFQGDRAFTMSSRLCRWISKNDLRAIKLFLR